MFRKLKDRISAPDKRLTKSLIVLAFLITAGWLLSRDYTVIGFLMVLTGIVSWGTAQLGIKWSGIELATLTTVLGGTVFGPAFGALIGFTAIIIQLSAGHYIGPYVVWVIPGYVIGGIAASLLSGGIFLKGAGILVALQVVFSLLTLVATPDGFSKYITYAVGNVVFNLFIFRFLAPELAVLI